MSKEEVFKIITDWEYKAGESFNDYFSHDYINDSSWAFFLLGKGFIEHSNNIIKEILDGNECIDQDVLYDVYPYYDEDGEDFPDYLKRYNDNTMIMAEFICGTDYYIEMFLKRFKEN